MDYVIQVYISHDRQDMVDFCIPFLLKTKARMIYIYTEKESKLLIPDNNRIKIVYFFETTSNWAEINARKIPMLLHLLETEELIYQCDADVLVIRDIGHIFDFDFDMAMTVYETNSVKDIIEDPHFDNIPLGSLWFKRTKCTLDFLKLWQARQDQKRKEEQSCTQIQKTGMGFSHNMLSCREILQQELHSRDIKILFLNRLIYNSFTMNPSFLSRTKWFKQLIELKDRVSVLHYPQDQFKDAPFVAQSVNYALGRN